MSFSVSVIIPAYNVECFIEKAISSALIQPEVAEIVVVDDGSTDNTIQIIEKLQIDNSKIVILHHPNNENRGRSATRNLGIKKATQQYIAFLDADDFYLSNRFTNDKLILENNLNIDGVYNAVGFHFYREIEVQEKNSFNLNTVNQKISPSQLFEALISGDYGYLHLNGLSVKASAFEDIGLLNEALVVGEDSDIIFKLAIKKHLEPSIINLPMAVRGIHNENVFNNKDVYIDNALHIYQSVFFWSYLHNVTIEKKDLLLKWIWISKFKQQKNVLNYISYWAFLFFKTPKLIFSYLSVKYFPVVRLRQTLFPFIFKN